MNKDLAAIIDKLKASANPTIDVFNEVFGQAQQAFEISNQVLAKRLKVSVGTVERWSTGQSAPHLLGRSAALNSLAEVCDEILNKGP